jgi:hypothetical protein
VDSGNEIAIKSIDGKVFNCFLAKQSSISPDNYLKRSYLLAVTETQIIELIPNPLKIGMAHVVDVHDLNGLAKLRFKKGIPGVLVLEYKSGTIAKVIKF